MKFWFKPSYLGDAHSVRNIETSIAVYEMCKEVKRIWFFFSMLWTNGNFDLKKTLSKKDLETKTSKCAGDGNTEAWG